MLFPFFVRLHNSPTKQTTLNRLYFVKPQQGKLSFKVTFSAILNFLEKLPLEGKKANQKKQDYGENQQATNLPSM